MKSPIMKLVSSRESLDKDLKDTLEKESEAKAEAEQIANQMEVSKAEADGTYTSFFPPYV